MEVDKACDDGETMRNSQFDNVFAERVLDVPRSFIREILNVALQPGMISFAGGLPNKDLFPVDAITAACDKVLRLYGREVLQYSSSEGDAGLRRYIAENYARRGVPGISPDNILITAGSQQALDLLSKVLLNEGDRVVIEEPSYLGAIQAMAIFRPTFVPVPISDEGMDVDCLKAALAKGVKMMYLIPNFQNPSGITYPAANRRAIAECIKGTSTFLIEDDPYGELRFRGTEQPSFKTMVPENTILLGSFSKTVAPGFRLGWVVLPDVLMEKMLVAKQAADLHTNSFCQRVILQYLLDASPETHIERIRTSYHAQKDAMISAIKRSFPNNVAHTDPDGGMFLWVTLPDNQSAMKLFELGAADHVCVVPGHPFYIGKDDVSTFRLNFSCSNAATIEEGVKRLGRAIRTLCPV